MEKADYGVIENASTDAGSAEDVEATARAHELAAKRRKLSVGGARRDRGGRYGQANLARGGG